MPAESTPLMTNKALAAVSSAGPSKERSVAIERAAWYIEDANYGFPPREFNEAPEEFFWKRDASLLSAYVNSWLLQPVLLGLVAIMMFEFPLWCDAASHDKWYNDYNVVCKPSADPTSQIYLSGLPYLPPAVGVLCELACYAVVFLATGLELRWRGLAEILRERPFTVAIMATAALATLDTFVYAIIWQSTVRLAPFCRLLIIAFTEPLRSTFTSTAEALPSYLRILFILVGMYIFMAFVYTTLLEDFTVVLPECQANVSLDPACPMSSDYFGNIGDATLNFVFIAACQNLPDLIIPSYAGHRMYGVLWLCTFVLINFVMLNVVLATVFNAYQASFKRRTIQRFKNRFLGLGDAYDELVAERDEILKSAGDDKKAAAAFADIDFGRIDKVGVAKPQFKRLVAELNKSATVRFVPENTIDYLFHTLDDDGDGCLDREEFYEVSETLNYFFTRMRTQSYVERKLPGVWAGLRLEGAKAWSETDRWYGLQHLMTFVMLLNVLAIISQSVLDQYDLQTTIDAGEHGPGETTLFTWIYFAFSVIYLLEVSLCCTVQPFILYYVEGGRLMDLTVSIAVSALSILWIYPYIYIDAQYVKYANLVRVLKLLKFVKSISSDFAFVFKALASIFRGAANVIGQLFLWTAFFVAVANQLFGGSVYHNAPALVDTDYVADYYEVLNFNDFCLGFVPFIATLVSAGPNRDLIFGIGDAVGSRSLSATFFFTYYYTTQLLVLNVLVSFVVTAYTIAHESHESGGGDDSDDSGLDAKQRANLESLYASLPAEPGWRVQASASENQDVLLQRMFRDDITRAIEHVAAEQTAEQKTPDGARTRGGGASRRNGNKSGKAKANAPPGKKNCDVM